MQAVAISDPALTRFLKAGNDAEASRLLESLLNDVEPTLRSVVRRRWGSASRSSAQDQQLTEDILSDVHCQLVARLRDMRGTPTAQNGCTPSAIGNFRAFAAVTAARVCDSYVREKYPNRNRLRRRLEYLLGEQSPVRGFAVWTSADGERLAGFDRWKREGRRQIDTAGYRRLAENPAGLLSTAFPNEDLRSVDPGGLVAAIFDQVGAPIALDDLVQATARLWGIVDEPQEALVDDEAESGSQPSSDGIEASLLRREYLRSLWSEIRQLPARQAAALLLNLRDHRGNGLIALLPITSTASFTEIARAMGMPPADLARIWNGLPLEDAAIAEALGCSRQQIINLRRSARERLTRKMASLSL